MLAQLRARRREILRVAEGRGARYVRVFSSVAGGEASPASGVDPLLGFEPAYNVLDLSELIPEPQNLLHPRVNVLEIRASSPMAEEIRREAVHL